MGECYRTMLANNTCVFIVVVVTVAQTTQKIFDNLRPGV